MGSGIAERAFRPGLSVSVPSAAQLIEQWFWIAAGVLWFASLGYALWPTPVSATISGSFVLIGATVNRSNGRPRYLDEVERLEMLGLTRAVGHPAPKLDRVAAPIDDEVLDPATGRAARAKTTDSEADPPQSALLRRPRTPLPDPKLVQRVIRQRRLRERHFESGLFADPAWDILLDLTAAHVENRRVSVSSLCIAAAVPATTALRWINLLTEKGILLREHDEGDKRRVFVTLSDNAVEAMARYFDELGQDGVKPI